MTHKLHLDLSSHWYCYLRHCYFPVIAFYILVFNEVIIIALLRAALLLRVFKVVNKSYVAIRTYEKALLYLQGVNKSCLGLKAYKRGLFPDQHLFRI